MADPQHDDRRHPGVRRGARRRRCRRWRCASGGAVEGDPRHRRRLGRRHGRAGAARPARDRHPPSVQQGQRRVAQDRHPPRRRRVDSRARRRRPASSRRRACASSACSATTTSSSARGRRQTQATATRRWGNDLLNRLAGYLAQRTVPDLTSGFRAARREHLLEFLHLLPNGFSSPTTTTLAFLRAGYNVRFEPIEARPAQRPVEDPAGPRRREVLPDPAEGHHDLQSAQDLRADQRGRLRRSASSTACGRSIQQSRIPNGAVLLLMFAVIVFLVGLVSEQISALRFESARRDRS